MTIAIAPLTEDHLDEVRAIDAQVYSHAWSRELFLDQMGRASWHHIVASEDGHVLGHAALLTAVDEAYVTTIAVDPTVQRRALGTRLMLALVEEALQRGAKALSLEVRVKNAPAQALYRRFGFAPAGIRKNYYQADNEDALIMWAHDVHTDSYAERVAAIRTQLEQRT